MNRFFSLIFLLVCLISTGAQPELERLDSIFSDWRGTDVPGGAVVIVKGGEVVWEKAFGMASLEYGVPNIRETVFNIASVSKQFTAYGILLLEKDGKLSLDDDIRTYLPEIPDFGEVITIRHLLHHTSGLRSLHALFHLAGWRDDDRRSNEDLLRFLPKQKDLNFLPGNAYLYCNTGFILSAVIIERITGQTFENWMQDQVFSPLGMDNSFFRRDYTLVVPNVATSYSGLPFKKSVEYWAYIGSGNMHSNTGDLALWINHFRTLYNQKDTLLKKMWTRGVLNDGDTVSYALGVVTGTYNGITSISHGGSIGGFRSYLAYLPTEDLGIAVLSNHSFGNPGGKAQKILDVFLDGNSRPDDTTPFVEKPV
jgi:CubicO group peptidase (beta-lactamase class C family)